MPIHITFNELSIGETYDRPYLAQLWRYKGLAAISKGIITPANDNLLVFFITKQKQGNQPHFSIILKVTTYLWMVKIIAPLMIGFFPPPIPVTGFIFFIGISITNLSPT